MATEQSMIELRDITFAYPGGATIFDRFSWCARRGQAWSVIGPSGCGKTTLLNLLAGLYRATAGQILIDGQPLHRPRPRTGLILQDYGLLPWATIRANATLGLDIRAFYGPDGVHAPADEVLDDREERVTGWLRRLGILHLARQYPHQVSGGQRQRAAIARTLALNPDVLLMDEPFGALDEPTRQDLQHLTAQLQREHGLTTVIVTHNIEEAVFLGQHILVLGQPVHLAPTIVDNPHAPLANTGDYPAQTMRDYRRDDVAYGYGEAFAARCRELRQLLGEEAREMA